MTSSSSQAQFLQYGVLRLRSWPDLPSLPEEAVHDCARVCALLAIRPTAVTLIPQLLGLSRERITHVLQNLDLAGHLMSSGMPAGPQPESLPVRPARVRPQSAPDRTESILAKLWQRLRLGY